MKTPRLLAPHSGQRYVRRVEELFSGRSRRKSTRPPSNRNPERTRPARSGAPQPATGPRPSRRLSSADLGEATEELEPWAPPPLRDRAHLALQRALQSGSSALDEPPEWECVELRDNIAVFASPHRARTLDSDVIELEGGGSPVLRIHGTSHSPAELDRLAATLPRLETIELFDRPGQESDFTRRAELELRGYRPVAGGYRRETSWKLPDDQVRSRQRQLEGLLGRSSVHGRIQASRWEGGRDSVVTLDGRRWLLLEPDASPSLESIRLVEKLDQALEGYQIETGPDSAHFTPAWVLGRNGITRESRLLKLEVDPDARHLFAEGYLVPSAIAALRSAVPGWTLAFEPAAPLWYPDDRWSPMYYPEPDGSYRFRAHRSEEDGSVTFHSQVQRAQLETVQRMLQAEGLAGEPAAQARARTELRWLAVLTDFARAWSETHPRDFDLVIVPREGGFELTATGGLFELVHSHAVLALTPRQEGGLELQSLEVVRPNDSITQQLSDLYEAMVNELDQDSLPSEPPSTRDPASDRLHPALMEQWEARGVRWN